MKIAHIITLAELGGAQSVVLNLVNQSVQQGHDVMVVSSANGELWNALPPSVHQVRLPNLQRKISWTKDIAVIRDLRHINSVYKPDIVHLHSSKIGILGRLAFPSSKIVYTIHGFDSIRIGFPKFLPLERALQSRTRHTVAVSQYDLFNLADEGITRNIRCIYNGIKDYQETTQLHMDQHVRDLGEVILSKKGFRVMCIARISPQKKFDLFCEIAEKMKDEDIQFFWIGNKEEMSDTPPNVHCLGQVEHAHQLLSYADLFILPTNYEGMPISIIEAFCYSVPVIASRVGGIAEMLDGQNGQAVENGVSTFSSAIQKYSRNPELLIASRAAARKSYEDHFTVDKMFAAYFDLYQLSQPASSHRQPIMI
jgi:glycosyltransferase involved in cell wall biosynthesis